METPIAVLQQFFGYPSFRGGQEALIEAQLHGRDVFGIMPTGGGKSICYQIPALMLPGITLVVSPLISLMQDQVMALKNAGIPAAFINSSLTTEQIRRVYANLRYGMYKIVYIAPERLATDGFLETAQQIEISLLAVDEAHCISQWGQDFRPSYLKIPEFLEYLPNRPVLAAFTATATEQVQQDVERILGLREPLKIVTGFDRPNLYFGVLQPKDKLDTLLNYLSSREGKSGIVYCSTRKETEAICDALNAHGYAASCYHAGLPDEERRESQADFVYDRTRIMVATNAFGMGIDKSNVSFVIHYNMPKSLEAYYQEAGRAGRDGEKAECILLYAPKDVMTAKYLVQHASENEALTAEERQEVVTRDMIRLDAMVNYCKTAKCLRGAILDYFGETHSGSCGNCSSCLSRTGRKDITRQAQIALSCIQRIYRKLGYSMGMSMVTEVLRGSRGKRLLELGLDTLPTYGMLKQVPQKDVLEILDALIDQGYLNKDPVYSTLTLTEKARGVLFGDEKVSMRAAAVEQPKKPSPRMVFGDTTEEDLLKELKRVRLLLANEQNIPAFMVFSNATLTDMAQKQPVTEEDFQKVSGVGKVKANKYADAFLSAIRQYLGEEGTE